MARSFKVLSPTAILGYGFPEESFRKAMAESPDLIAVDAGSSDPGPHYLGAGKPF
ncbi:3-methylaspartate ammonia-lyase, partial [Escherichia coli]